MARAGALVSGNIRLGAVPARTVSAGQYPPGGYPPTTYPGGGYPGGGYPGGGYPGGNYPNTYPTRLPGGVPVGLPVPEVKLPKRGEKDKPKCENDVKVTMAAVDGALRKLGEKDLVLQSGPKKLLRFRLLAKTQFRDKEGEAVRDSLLHPGDQLSVQVNTDDEETALRVTLLKTGTPPSAPSADLPFDEATVRAPKSEDLGKAKSVTVQQASSASDTGAAAPAPASAESTPDGSPPAPAPAIKPLGRDDEIIQEAREEAATFTAGLPDFAVQQLTTRYFSVDLAGAVAEDR